MSGITTLPADFEHFVSDDTAYEEIRDAVSFMFQEFLVRKRIVFSPWVSDYLSFHFFHKHKGNVPTLYFIMADNGVRELENALAVCNVCAAQQGEFYTFESKYGFAHRVNP